MSSGVKVSDQVLTTYNAMKLGKKHRYMTMIIEGGFVVIKELVERADDQKKDFDEFVSKLPKDDCRYLLLDLDVSSKSGQSKPMLFLITWCPDSAKVKEKMLYASSRSAVTEKIHEGTKQLQANDITDLEYDDLLIMGAK